MSKLDDLRNASKDAAAQTNQQLQDKITQLKSFEVKQIIAALKQSSVDQALVANLEAEIAVSTNKNETLLNVINKGEAVGKLLVDIIKKIS